MKAILPLTRAQAREAVKVVGIGWGNGVRPPKLATRLSFQRGMVVDGPLTGAFINASLWHGHASDGYKTNYQRRPRWWTLLQVTDEAGHVVWAMGTRFADEAKARADYKDSAASIREGR